MKPLSVGAALKNAFSVAGQNLLIVLLIALVGGGLRDVLVTRGVQALADAFLEGVAGRPLLVYTQLAQLGLVTLWGCIFGAWAAPATIYLWVQREKGQAASLYDAVNYGLNRFSQVLRPHAISYFFIQLGSIIIVPQILLGIQWAFVDAIATLDRKETAVLARSRRLTGVMRSKVFLAFLPFLVWWVAYMLFVFNYGFNASLWVQLLSGTIDYAVLAVIDLVMVQFYLDLFRNRAQPATAPAPAEPAGS